LFLGQERKAGKLEKFLLLQLMLFGFGTLENDIFYQFEKLFLLVFGNHTG